MGEEIQVRFETSGQINTDLISRFAKYHIMSPKYIGLIIVYFVLMILCMMYLLWMGSNMSRFVGVLIVVAGAAYAYRCCRAVKNTVDRFLEQAPEGVVGYQVAFSEDSLHVHNLSSGGKSTLALCKMKYLVQINDVWMLVTKSNLFSPIFISQLSETDQKSVLTLLKANNPKIHIQLPRKK